MESKIALVQDQTRLQQQQLYKPLHQHFLKFVQCLQSLLAVGSVEAVALKVVHDFFELVNHTVAIVGQSLRSTS